MYDDPALLHSGYDLVQRDIYKDMMHLGVDIMMRVIIYKDMTHL